MAVGRHWLLAGGRDGRTHLLRASDGLLHSSWPGAIFIRSVAINANETWAAVGSQDGVVRIMSLPAGKVLATCRDHAASVDGVAIDSWPGQFLVTCSKENRVHIYNLADFLPTPHVTLTVPSGPVRGLCFMPHTKTFVFIAGPETAVRVWNLNELQRHLTVMGIP